ncbi:amidase [Staphylococcus xylosus]|uniref:Amidase n=1 Tax=Staphylococcus xylosus TaxID=1288 RepID=A0A418INC6_STAXY|nr:amidase [Staphylococcus xylosus]RIN10659.1 amidase [Staphylococcus xylosus]
MHSIKELLNLYKSNQLIPKNVVFDYIDNIINNDSYNTFITITQNKALEDIENHSKKNFLIPISIKDIYDIKGYPTSNGYLYHKNDIACTSSTMVKTLEEKGFLIVGKNNLTTYSTSVTSKNSIYGDVINPKNKYLTAGGSSSGSAVAVASNMVPCALGSDTSGSTRIPASCCGIVGLKPTYDKSNTTDMTPISQTLDHVGFLTRDVKDIEILFAKLNNISTTFKRKINIGVPLNYFSDNIDSEINDMMEEVYSNFKDIGFSLLPIDTSFLNNQDLITISRNIGTPEMAIYHTKYINQKLYPSYLKELFLKSKNITSIDYLKAMDDRLKLKNKFNKIFKKIDVLLTPTMPIKVPKTSEKNKFYNGSNYDIENIMIKYTTVFNLTGHPAMTIPSGYILDNVSQGIQLIAPYNREHLLFDVARSYEDFIAKQS